MMAHWEIVDTGGDTNPRRKLWTAKGDNMIKMSRRAWLGMAGAAAAVGVVGLPPLQRESRARHCRLAS